jgi:hypothetical protein
METCRVNHSIAARRMDSFRTATAHVATRTLVCQQAPAAPLVFWLMPVASLAGGVRIVETRRPIAGGEETTTTMRADENRAEVHTENGSERYTVNFWRQPGVLWFVDHQRQFYREMSRETLAAMTDNLQRLLESMREAARRPPKKPSFQQEGKQPPQYPFFLDPAPGSPAHPPPTELKMSPAAPLSFVKIWSGEQVNGWPCDRYEGHANGEKVWDVCVAGWKELGIRRAEFAILDDLVKFWRDSYLPGSNFALEIGPQDWQQKKAYPGLPVQRILVRDGKPAELFEVREIAREEFSATDFAPPPGYQKRVIVMFDNPAPDPSQK